ncbi:MAG: M48 family metallopeptidase [Bryobacterales bacterium]|nr:M48 family metallopeptidase [Bryobacterales bacterium]
MACCSGRSIFGARYNCKRVMPLGYSLPPDKLQRAIEYSHAVYRLHFGSEIYGILILAVIVASGLGAKFRDWAEARSKRRFVQALVFVPLLVLTNDIVYLPANIYGQHLELKFNQSIQSWPSWFWDWTKTELIMLVCGVPLAFLLYWVIRRSPQRWWLYFWLSTLPITVTVMYLEPMVIEPLFYRFEPLAAAHPALVNELEKLVARGGLAIPPSRMFEMKASEKLSSLNAYVSGFGGSKRVVVWDTTIQSLTTPETLFVFGHEMGHYVLGHIRDSLFWLALLLLVLLFVGSYIVRWVIARWGNKWRIRGTADWASLPLLLLIAAIFSFFSEPLVNGYSRWQEHQADIYGLEIIHGIVPDSSNVAARSFQVMGEIGLDEPNPNHFIEFWLYSHPSTGDRLTFAESYDPWDAGKPRYVRREPE